MAYTHCPDCGTEIEVDVERSEDGNFEISSAGCPNPTCPDTSCEVCGETRGRDSFGGRCFDCVNQHIIWEHYA